jgi:CRP-like cAMP-binding protein
MSVSTDLLESLELFADLSSQELGKIAANMNRMRVKEGEELFRRNRPAHTFYVILSGHFLVSFQEGRALTLHRRGDIMGWSTVVTPFRYTATGTALRDGEVLTISGDTFLDLIRGDSPLGDRLMQRITAVVADRLALAGKSD